MDEQQLLNYWRKRYQAERQVIARIMADQARTHEWRRDERRRRLQEMHAAAGVAMFDALMEIARRRAAQRRGIPGLDPAAVENVLEGLRNVGRVTGTPASELKELSTGDLEKVANRAEPGKDSSAVTVANIRAVLQRRVEQGEAGAEALAAGVTQLLTELVAAVPSVVSRRNEYERLGIAEANLNSLLRAIESGDEDAGQRDDLYRDLSARIESGQISKDEARTILDQKSTAA